MVYYLKEGFPQEKELVICTVKKILPHAVLCVLDEYHNKEGMIHVSELSHKWVKNIKDIVTEGKQIVAKVLDVNERKGHIDLSLRKVSNAERENKFKEWRLEKRVDKLLQVAEQRIKEKKGSYEVIGDKILDEYGALYIFYEECKEKGRDAFKNLGITKKWEDAIYSIFEEQFKTIKVVLKGHMKVKSYEGDGLSDLKDFFNELLKYSKEKNYLINIKYLGAPLYYLTLTSKNYKIGEEQLSDLLKFAEKKSKEKNLKFVWERIMK